MYVGGDFQLKPGPDKRFSLSPLRQDQKGQEVRTVKRVRKKDGKDVATEW